MHDPERQGFGRPFRENDEALEGRNERVKKRCGIDGLRPGRKVSERKAGVLLLAL